MSKQLKARTPKKPKKALACVKDSRQGRRKKAPARCKAPAATKKSTYTRASPTGPVAAPRPTAPNADAFPTPAAAPTAASAAIATTSAGNAASQTASAAELVVPYTGPPTINGLPVFTGSFGRAAAQRLLLRAGFGPSPGQTDELVSLGLRGAVDRLVRPSSSALVGAAPSGPFLVNGALAPTVKPGHLHLQMLDRMIRASDPLTERMTLVLHDWFALSQTAVERPFLAAHIDLLRANWRGSFRGLLLKVTTDPGMLVFLDGVTNRKGTPNENYAREFMELYALGADRGAYTEADVRELARTFTGWKNDWSSAPARINFGFDPARFDAGTKSLFTGKSYARSGNLGTTDGVNAVVDHPMHPSFVVLKLWSYFVPTAPSTTTQAALEALYRSSGERLEALVEAILLHPDLYLGPSMAKPPVVYAASLLRALGRTITSDAWIWWIDAAGQLLGAPPSVSGWNDLAWINTSTFQARWVMATQLLWGTTATSASYKGRTESPDAAVDAAAAFWGGVELAPDHRASLVRLASRPWPGRVPGDPYGAIENFYANRQNMLRQMVAGAPDFQVS